MADEERAGASQSLAGALREGVEQGRASLALLDAWASLSGGVESDADALADILKAAAGGDARRGLNALSVEPDTVAIAILDSRMRARAVSPRFAEWVGDPAESIDCHGLALAAAREGRAIGPVRTLNHGVLALMAVRDAAARGWPGQAADFLCGPEPDDLVLAVFAPSRSKTLVLRTATAMGMSPLEARLSAEMVVQPSLESAAVALGVSRETAKDALGGAMRRTGARRALQLVGRLIDLSANVAAGQIERQTSVLGALGLSPAEQAVARRVSLGDTAEEAGLALNMKAGTVKAYRRSIFDKLGINRARDLRRLLTEAAELGRLADADEVSAPAVRDGALRIFSDPDGRSIACLDYGPPRGKPVVVMHGYSTGRTAPPPLLAAFGSRGYRVIIPQRPGFGLTTPAVGDYVDACVADLLLVLDRLECAAASLLARDGAAPSALAFAARHPDRVGSRVLLNPRTPQGVMREKTGPMTAISLMLLNNPALVEPFCAMMARQLSSDIQVKIFQRLLAGAPADRACFERPEVAARLLDDLRRLMGRGGEGYIAELRLYALGWQVPRPYAGPPWRLAASDTMASTASVDAWREVVEGPPTVLEGAGYLAQFTHADAIAALVAVDV